MVSFRQRLLLSELRQQGIRDPAVLDAMNAIPRERFVDPSLSGQAYSNAALPIGYGQSISQPFVVAFMTEALQVTKDHKVLEIGTGSGYQAAVLARLCKIIFSIERIAELGRLAEQIFMDLKISNIKTKFGDGVEGWPEEAPFDRIIVTAASKLAPPVLAEQLKPGGVMVLPLGKSPDKQHIYRLTKTDDTIFSEKLLAVRFVPLISGNNIIK